MNKYFFALLTLTIVFHISYQCAMSEISLSMTIQGINYNRPLRHIIP